MKSLADALRAHPELAVFATLGLGHALARVRLGPIQLNPVIGVLSVGVVIGQLGIAVSGDLQWAFFVLFLFAIGHRTGPQFFRGLGRDALPQVVLAVILCALVLGCVYATSRALGFDAGGAAGLLAGGLNASAAIGTGGEAVAKLPLDEAERLAMQTNLAVGFAVTYLVGLVTAIVTLAKLGPLLMRVDLAAACHALEAELGVAQKDFGVFSAYQEIAVRAYAVPADEAGRTVASLESCFAGARVFAVRVRRDGHVEEPSPTTQLRAGDVVMLCGRRASLVDAANPLRAHELDDATLLDVPVVSVDAVVARPELDGRTLGEIAASVASDPASRAVFARKLARGGHELPVGPGTRVLRGDVLSLVGPAENLTRLAAHIGPMRWPSAATDLVAMCAAIALGGLLGLLSTRVGPIDVGLSLPVGVLLGGLVVGWLHSLRPDLARAPQAALSVLESLGLSGFLAIVGLGAGPGFVGGLASSGPALVGAGVIVCLVPMALTILAGRYVFRLHPGIVLGIVAGAGTSPAGLAAVQDEAKSRVPTLGYGVSYAVGNVLLALWGSVIVALLAPR